MSDETTTTPNTEETKAAAAPAEQKTADATSSTPTEAKPRQGGFRGRRPGGQSGRFAGRGRRPGRRPERQKPEFDQKVLEIRRVTRVVAGGRRFSFSVAMAIGDRKGRVGVGTGKAGDTTLAIQKAINRAKKNMVRVEMTDEKSIKYQVAAKFKSANVELRPNQGRGIVAGSAIRVLIELLGLNDISGRVLSRSKNKLNIARATLKALEPFSTYDGGAPKKPAAPKEAPIVPPAAHGTDPQKVAAQA